MEHIWAYERTNSDELCHYGVKGMRWGFRKKVSDAGRAINNVYKRNKQKIIDVGDYAGSKVKKVALKSPLGIAVKGPKKSPAGKVITATKKDYTKFLIDKYGKKKVSELNKKQSK